MSDILYLNTASIANLDTNLLVANSGAVVDFTLASSVLGIVSASHALKSDTSDLAYALSGDVSASYVTPTAYANAFKNPTTYLFSTAAVGSDPGDGYFRANSTFDGVSIFEVAGRAAEPGNVGNGLDLNTILNAINPGKWAVIVRQVADPNVYGLYTITSVVNNTTYYTLNVSTVDSSGTVSPANNSICELSFLNLNNTTIETGSFYPISSSWADNATTSAFALTSTSASHALVSDTSDLAYTATSASHALVADSADSVVSSSHALAADVANSVLGTIQSASYAINADTASYLVGGIFDLYAAKFGTVSASSFTNTGADEYYFDVVFGTAYADDTYTVQVTGEDARVWSVSTKTTAGFTIESNSGQALTGYVWWNTNTIGEYNV